MNTRAKQHHCFFMAHNPFIRPAGKTRGRSISRTVALTALFAMCVIVVLGSPSLAQVNGQGQLPYMGWSSWTQEVLHGSAWETEAEIKIQSDELKSSGLQAAGYIYINMDSGWASGFDSNGRPAVNLAKFPDGMAATIQYIHNNGQKAGIYWIPGVEQPAWSANYPILGTPYTLQDIVLQDTPGNAFSYGATAPYHKKIDFTKPGAQEYVNSDVALFASWGVDFIKLDGVTPGSDHNDLTIDNRPDVAAWSQAVAHASRPIWLTVSWNLDHNYLSTWQTYANARRIDDDIECYCSTATSWANVALRFTALANWQNDSGPTKGWNDLDSLEVGNSTDGLTNNQRQTQVTLWAIANAPMFIGDDLTTVGAVGFADLENAAVNAVDQSGKPGLLITAGNNQVWASPALSNGKYNVALFNLGSSTSTTTVNWTSLGFSGSADVYNDWTGTDLGIYANSYSASLATDSSSLLTITPVNGLIAFSVPPSSSVAEGSSAGTVTVEELNPDGSVYISGSDQITLTVTGPLSYLQTYQTNAVSGVASFNLSGVTLATAGTYNYVATSATYTAQTVAATENVAASVIGSFTVAGVPFTAVNGQPYTVTVTARDTAGSIMTSFTGAVTLISSDPAALIAPSSYVYQTSDLGVHTFAVTLNTGGLQSITATTTGGATGSEPGIQVGGFIWMANNNSTLTRLTEAGTGFTTGSGAGGSATYGGIAFDATGNLWSVNSAANQLLFATNTGSGATTYAGGGLDAPAAIAVDGAGYIWVANSGNNTVSVFNNAGVAQSPSVGYGTSDALNAPSSVAIDNTGGVWVTSKSSNSVTHILGAATPVLTPAAFATANAALGTTP